MDIHNILVDRFFVFLQVVLSKYIVSTTLEERLLLLGFVRVDKEGEHIPSTRV